jgi:hypothetical protein
VAFALDFHDPSENVTNEVRWAVQSQAHTFFLIHAGPTNPESQGLVIGTLATHYLLTTGRPEYPEFGCHFCGSLDSSDLQQEALVAAHRIVAHRDRCLSGPLRQYSADNDAKLTDMEQRPEARARRFLLRLQEAGARGYPPEVLAALPPALQAARRYLHDQEALAAQEPLSARQIDQFRRADEILGRCQPGPHEISAYFGPLVLQAACVESMIHDDLRQARPQALDFRPAVVLGTVPFTGLVEPWVAVAHEGYGVLVFDAAFIDFLYQTVKVSVASAKATVVEQAGGRGVQLDFHSVPAQLGLRPALLQGFHRCVRRYAAAGIAAPSTDGPPALETQQALGTYLRLAERTLAALGYGALTLQGAAWPPPALETDVDPDKATPQQRQMLLDLIALDHCVRSRRLIDAGNTMHAVIATLFLHCTVHIRQQMLVTLHPDWVKWAGETPTQLSARLQGLLQYVGRRMAQGGAPAAVVRQSLEDAWVTGTTPLQLWAHVEQQLRADREHGLRALPAWG